MPSDARSQASKWPKVLPPLTAEQQRKSDAFVKIWHEVLPARFQVIERFNHGFPVRHSPPNFLRTLELGAGLGEHLQYEQLTPEQGANYYANELRENMAAEIRRRYPDVHVVQADCQQRLDFPDGFFDRVIAVHVFEHLPSLPSTIRESYRLLNREVGRLLIVIPTEGSPAYSLARKISAERVFKKHIGGDYSWFYKREHINLPHEIQEELQPYFIVRRKTFFPLSFAPMTFCNLCIGLALEPRRLPLAPAFP